MQKVIIQVDWSDEKRKKKAIKLVSQNEDIKSFSVDDEKKQLTFDGDMDAVSLVKKMRKHFPMTQIINLKSETPVSTAVKAPAPEPPPPYGHPYYPNPPNGYHPYGGYNGYPPYWGYNGYYPPQ